MIKKIIPKRVRSVAKFLKWPLSTILKLIIAVNIALIAFNIGFSGRIFPNVKIADVDVSGLTPSEANNLLSQKLELPKKLKIDTPEENFEIDLANIDLKYEVEATAYAGFSLFRTGNFFFDLENRVKSLWEKRNLALRITYDENKLRETVSVIAGEIAVEPVYPAIKIQDKQIVIEKGSAGSEADFAKLESDIKESIAYARGKPIYIVVVPVDPSLSESQALTLKTRAEKLLDKKLVLTFEFSKFVYSGEKLLALVGPKGGVNEEAVTNAINTVAPSVERSPQNPTFVFENGIVKEFAPAKTGVAIDKEKLGKDISEKLIALENEEEVEKILPIAVTLTESEVQTSEVNDLGIKELIGRGTSTFRGSIPSRVFNVNLASTRLNGVLIKPGEEFSFNSALGDVSKLTGYKEAYVIKDGKTVLGDGGGVCQVSTTLFRAAMDAGLPIIERRAHAYRVGYYEQDSGPGLDATIYSPTTDFKLKNDTPGHILIQTKPDTKNLTLVFELYGTSDGRVSKVTKPVIGTQIAPSEDSYVDDPTLPAGTIKQIEHRAWGAKTSFNYTVERAGQTIYEKTFVSNYRPWQAVYLRGTGPVQ